MTIALDIDEVMIDLISAILEFHNANYGTRLAREDFISYRLSMVFKVGDEEATRRMIEFFESEYFLNAKPIEGAVECVPRLREKGDLISITSRLLAYKDETEQCLERYFPGIFTSRIYFAINHYVKGSGSKSKGYYCQEFGVETLVEDSIAHAKECRDVGTRVLLFDQPHNGSEEPEGIIRVKNWQEVMEQFK